MWRWSGRGEGEGTEIDMARQSAVGIDAGEVDTDQVDADDEGLSILVGSSRPMTRSTAAQEGSLTVSDGRRRPVEERSAVGEIGDWGRRYLRSHPLMSLAT